MSANERYDGENENVDLTSFALGELSEGEAERMEALLAESLDMQDELAGTREMAGMLEQAFAAEPEDELTQEQRSLIIEKPKQADVGAKPKRAKSAPWRFATIGSYVAAAAVVLVAGVHYWSPTEEGAVSEFTYNLGDGKRQVARNDLIKAEVNAPSEEGGALLGLGYLGDIGDSDGIPPAYQSRNGLVALGYSGDIQASSGKRASGRTAPKPSSNETYAHIRENAFRTALGSPLSTFSIDVDTASYSNVRRFLNDNQLPPIDAIRIEELINYFNYDYPSPDGRDPFSVSMEVASAPWNPARRLVRIGLRGKDIAFEARRPTNLVFLLDVSGSMNSPDKLPLVKKSLRLLVDQLEVTDHVSIAVYAGAAGLILPPTSGNAKGTILEAVERLSSGGSTNGGEGIRLAYNTAAKHFNSEGINRVILCTDGDFNVGLSGQGELIQLVKKQAKSGIELSVLGFGTGNLKDATMEQIADNGNGNYAYIDGIREARKVLVEELGGTLVTIAKDVKIQVEFNPLEVESYRLIGYENRVLANEDFNDDTVDAGEIGSSHTVTALYEVVPVNSDETGRSVDPLKYQQAGEPSTEAGQGELLTVKLRYKAPKGSESRLIERSVVDAGISFDQASEDTRFAASVASFGMLLRKSEFSGSAKLSDVMRWASQSLGNDRGGYRTEFIGLIARSITLKRNEEPQLLDEATRRQLEDFGYTDEE
ncbi:MAG: Ca-activated chloride channel family protein [Planctomycetota bacterium]|jgi:Ca-activated chloride channel family protein